MSRHPTARRPAARDGEAAADLPPAARNAHPLERADILAAERLARHRRDPAVRAAGALSEIADQPPLLALCGAVLAVGLLAGDRRLAATGGRMLASVLAATAVKTAFKRLVSRTRPHVLLDEGRYAVEAFGPDEGPWQSFPSGHTAGGVAAARALARAYPQAGGPAACAAAAVALVQIPRGAHYPLDVAAGALIGLAAEAAVERAIGAAGRPGAPGRVDRPGPSLYRPPPSDESAPSGRRSPEAPCPVW